MSDWYRCTESGLRVCITAHTLGRGHGDRSGFEGAWTKEPLVFDNR